MSNHFFETPIEMNPSNNIEMEMESSTEDLYNNDLIYEKGHDILINVTADVHFIFEAQTDVVKVSANKAILAASSPVFNAMFNGKLKEEDNIKIVDVSAPAFKEFLQFFYEHKVKLTMENISDVVKLIDKYDVAGGSRICVQFLMENLTFDEILLGLDLSIKFRMDELTNFCKDKINGNYKAIFDNINFDDDGKLCPSNDRLSEIDWKTVLPHVFMASKSFIRKISHQLENKGAIYCVTLSSAERSFSQMTENETIVFSVDKPMMLTDIVCSKVIKFNDVRELSFDMTIERKPYISSWYSQHLHTETVDIKHQGLDLVKLTAPIIIESDYVYAINFKSKKPVDHFYTYKSIVKEAVIELAPNVNIRFLGNNDKSLISVLYLTHLNEN